MVKFTFFSFFINDFLKRQYPESYEWIIIYGTHKIIYFVSSIQLLSKKINNYFVPILRNKLSQIPLINNLFVNNDKNDNNDNDNNDNNDELNVEFIRNGNIIHLANINEIKNEQLTCLNLPFEYDFMIYSKYDVSAKIDNKIIFYRFPNNEEYDYEKSKIKFILSEFIIGDKSIKVDFKSDTYNYYLENNVFEQRFLKYFIKKYYFDEIKDIENMEASLDSMILKIIDHNASTETFDYKNILKFDKNNYKKMHLL
jgi:hypothetical protein